MAKVQSWLSIISSVLVLCGFLVGGVLWIISTSNSAAGTVEIRQTDRANNTEDRLGDKLDVLSRQIGEVKVDVKEMRNDVQNLKVGQARLESQVRSN